RTVSDPRQALTRGPINHKGRQALLRISAAAGKMKSSQALDQRTIRRVYMAQRNEVLSQRPVLLSAPCPERGDKPVLVDQAVLQRQQSKEHVACRVGRPRHRSSSPVAFSSAEPSIYPTPCSNVRNDSEILGINRRGERSPPPVGAAATPSPREPA